MLQGSGRREGKTGVGETKACTGILCLHGGHNLRFLAHCVHPGMDVLHYHGYGTWVMDGQQLLESSCWRHTPGPGTRDTDLWSRNPATNTAWSSTAGRNEDVGVDICWHDLSMYCCWCCVVRYGLGAVEWRGWICGTGHDGFSPADAGVWDLTLYFDE